MKFWANLKKYAGPVILGAMSFDSWLTSKKDSFKDKILEESLQKGLAKEKALEEANRKSEEIIQTLKVKLTSTSDRLDNSSKNVQNYWEKLNDLNKELANDPQSIEAVQSNIKYYEEMYKNAIKQQELDIKELQTLSNINDPNIVKSDLADLFNNLIDNYKDFLNTLTSEQTVIVFNIIGYISLLITLTSITTILLGDKIINLLKLEIRYPKLAKYIKFKQTLNKYYLRFYIVLFYILILLLISINIFMFSLEYFL